MTTQVPMLEIDNLHAKASISLFGGQVLSFRPHRDGRERLFMANAARLDGQAAIRGGIPVCWPWFGSHREDSSLPAHGWLRKRLWQVIEQSESLDATLVILQPESTSGPGFNGKAEVELHISVGEELRLDLFTRNIGSEPFRFTCALHSYFAVQDVRQVSLQGLHGEYRDKLQDWAVLETPSPYHFSGATDRIHMDRPARLFIEDAGALTTISSSGHDSIVVWNPWREGASQLADMNAEDYVHMLCVETALTEGSELLPGHMHLLSQGIR